MNNQTPDLNNDPIIQHLELLSCMTKQPKRRAKTYAEIREARQNRQGVAPTFVGF